MKGTYGDFHEIIIGLSSKKVIGFWDDFPTIINQHRLIVNHIITLIRAKKMIKWC